MQVEEVRFLYGYDRWATRRVLAQLDRIDEEIWTSPNIVDKRGLGSILVHQLGAAQRWRHGFQQSDEMPRPEREPLLSVAELMHRWDQEWLDTDAWLAHLDAADLDRLEDGVPVWQMIVHVINHGTQHRSEAAVLLTAEGESPGDLDLIFYAEELAGVRS